MVVKADRPLVGDFADHMVWYVLAGGLLASLLVAALVEVVNRRRAYALRLVETRTGELRDALEEKEQLAEGQRRARELADEANLSKSEFLSRMSHELRTPLNAVLGFAQLLETEDIGDDNRDAVRQILKGGRHLLELINEVLDITRIETGRLPAVPGTGAGPRRGRRRGRTHPPPGGAGRDHPRDRDVSVSRPVTCWPIGNDSTRSC